MPRTLKALTNSRGRANKAAIAILIILLLLIAALVMTRTRSRPRPAPPPPPAAQLTEDDVRANNRGVGMMGRYEYDRARAVFADLVDRHPDWLDARVNLAIATLNRQRAGDEDAALAMVRDVLRVEPQHVRARYVLALLLLYQGERDEALTHLTRVAQADPSDAFAAYFIGQIHLAREELIEAIEWYDRAIEHDPYLRSAYYGKSRALAMLDREDESDEVFERFRRLEPNPRAHLAEFVYTRMGPKATAQAVAPDAPRIVPPAPPEGPIFADPVPLLTNGDAFTWRVHRPDRPVSVTAADINNNGLIDIFIAGVLDDPLLFNAVCINNGDGTFGLDPDHVLASVPHVNAALWGDFDDDGLVDVYLCRRGPNMLWRQGADGVWEDVTAATGTSGGRFDTVDGLFFDADHDGDLDIFLVNADGYNELLNNNRDGTPPTFTPIAQQQGIAGDGRASRQVIAVDLDRDRDLDLIIINEEQPHEVYINDLLWQYQPAEGFEDLVNAELQWLVAGDFDADGQVELYGLRERAAPAQRLRWRPDAEGRWRKETLPDPQEWNDEQLRTQFPVLGLALIDLDGDSRPNLLSLKRDALEVWSFGADADSLVSWIVRWGVQPAAGWLFVNLDVNRGPALVHLPARGGPPMIRQPGPGRYDFAAVEFTGMDDPGHALRSNRSGIGTHFAARFGTHWVAGSTLPNHSGPGQSLQPIAIGLAGEPQIDFIAIDWSDGVFQSEIDLAAGELHTITETQRQLASCPVLFVWNGEKYEFASDVLGVAGMGFAIGPGEYAEPRPWERYLFKEGLLQPKDGRYVIKIGEPMEEALYLDTAALVVYDLPPGWDMTVDERMGINDPQPTGESIFYRRSMLPVRAVNDRGEDLTAIVREQDYRAAPVGELDLRFIGRLAREHVLEFEFERAIDAEAQGSQSVGVGSRPYLVADGWIEYPYSQTMFAAWQAGADYRAPTLEAMDPATGEWKVLLEQFGYPAGFPRQMAVPIPVEALPAGASKLRLRTNQEIYWDRLMIVFAEPPPPDLVRRELELVRAEVKRTGFAQRVLFDQRRAYYDYANRLPLWDTRHQSGFYSHFGCVLELVRERNDALAIIGPGEEIHMEFSMTHGDPEAGMGLWSLPESDWTRRLVIGLHGWCKDMDMFTQYGSTLEPIPSGGLDGDRDVLHRQFNTRFRSGR